MSAVVGLVLAAGVSQRFGSDKRRALLNSGSTLLGASVAIASARLQDVWVVLRPADVASELGISAPIRLVHSEHAELGMGHSLASGIRAIAQDSAADAVAIFLGDMPWVTDASLAALLGAASAQRIILPVHNGQPGHPVIIGRQFWPELLALRGDSGAKSVLMANPHAVHRIQVNDSGVLLDVDTPAHL